MILFVGSFVVTHQLGDLNSLKYPSRSMIDVLASRPVDTSGMEDLRYPTDSLFSSILSKIFGVFTSFMVSS